MGIEKKVQNAEVPDVQDDSDYGGIVGRMAEAAKSRYGKLATGIATGLLAAGLYAANPGKAKAQEPAEASVTQEEGKRLPDLSGKEPVGKKRVDELDLPGKESVMVGYNLGNKQILLYKLNDKVYSFSVKHPDGTRMTYADETHDGFFEQESKGSLDPKVDFDSYFKK